MVHLKKKKAFERQNIFYLSERAKGIRLTKASIEKQTSQFTLVCTAEN